MSKASLLELAKKLNISRRNCIITKEELEEAIKDTITRYKDIVFGSDTPSCMACLEEVQRQQVIDQHVYDQKLMEDTMRKFAWERLQKIIVMDGDTMIDKRTREVFNPEVDSTYWKGKFQGLIFIIFMDHKITCHRAGSFIF